MQLAARIAVLALPWIRLVSVKKGYAAALRILAVAAVMAGGSLIALGFLEERAAFHPSRLIERTPQAVGIAHEEVRLRASDGETIAGWWITAPDPVAQVLFLHGNAGNISHRLYQIALLNRAGFSVLIVDYRGYGESTGSPTEAGLYLDARAAWEHMVGTREISPGRILIYGESIGSVPALRLAGDIRQAGDPGPAALVLEGAFTSALDMGRRLLPFLPLRLVMSLKMDNLSAITRIETPLLFIHGSRDEIVPIRMGRRLYESAVSPVRSFVEVPGAMHNSVWLEAGSDLPDRIKEFLSEAGSPPGVPR